MAQDYTETLPVQYKRNRFTIDFETEDIKDYYVQSASFYGDRLSIKFHNSEAFFAPKYFSDNKRFKVIQIFLLNHLGEKKASITFRNAEVEGFMTDALDYGDNETLYTEVVFVKVEY